MSITEQTENKFNSEKNIRAPIDVDANTLTVGQTAIVSEPSADINGNVVFMTGNWWAARSTDGGKTFSFVDPTSDFPTFCCDQDVIYNEKHNVWVWYRQGFFDSSLGGSGFKNDVKISVSTDNAMTWCSIQLTATDLNPGLTDHFIDYPHLQTSDDKLHITTNIFDNVAPNLFTASIRLDLAELATCSFPVQVFLSSTEFNFTPVNGASDTMYFAGHLSDTQTLIRSSQDSSDSIGSATVTYPAYAFSGYSCNLTSTGTNPCGRSDSRIMGGYINNGVVGFVWDAAQAGSFLFPYVNFITVDASSGTLLSNIPLFSDIAAANFANLGVTNSGDVGVGLFLMGGTTNPTFLVGIDDSQTGANLFDFNTVKTSSHGTAFTSQWGDYIRIKPMQPDNGRWMGTGFTMQGGATDTDVENLFVTFGRNTPSDPPCSPPVSGNWIIIQNCELMTNTSINANVVIQNNSILTIPNGITLDIDFANFNLTVESGSGIEIKSGGAIT